MNGGVSARRLCVATLVCCAHTVFAQDEQHTPPTSSATAQDEAAPLPATIPVDPGPPAPPPTAAETPTDLDEIVVTAQKVKQSARDVPISMSVLSDDFVAQHGIVDIVQAMQYVPNVKISSAGFFAAPQARGFSFNNNNKAFESPLGIAFDGIPYTNTTYFNAGLFDIQRVEVLRGPQGTTFGKNTTAGLVSVVTADPTSEFSGVSSVQFGQLGRKHAELALSGPVHDDFAEFRVAGIYDDLSGFMHNTTAAISQDASALLRGYLHRGYRGKLGFPNLFGTELKVSFESVDLNSGGAGIELWEVSENVKAVCRKYDPNADFVLGNLINSEDGPDFRNAHTDTFVGEWTVPFGSWDVTALGGWSQLKEKLAVDTDFTPVPALNGYGGDRFPTTSFELRAKSSTLDGLFGLSHLFSWPLGHTDFLGGFFFQRRSIRDSNLRFVINDGPATELIAAAETPDGGNPGQTQANLQSGLGTSSAGPESFNQVFDQTGRVIALFEQTEWAFRPEWKLQLGLRASKEHKEGIWNDVFDTSGSNPIATALGLQAFSAQRTLSETQYQPKASLNWQPTRELSLFVHWTRGFKGGGFNAFAYRSIDEELVFKPERTTELGIDLKGSYFGGTLRPNLSVYRMNARDFQVLGREKPPVAGNSQTCDPTRSACFPPSVIGLGTTRVFNAESAYAQGVEGDLNWLAFGGFSLLATLGYNDTKYVKFTQNECPSTTSATYCDASGKPFAFAPRWDATFTPSLIVPLFGGLVLTPNVTAQYMSSQFLDTHLSHRQAAFMRYNATVGVGNPTQGWSFQVVGNNLTDRRTSIRYGDVLPNYEVAAPEAPRQVFGQFRWTF